MTTFEDEILRRTADPTNVRTGIVVAPGVYDRNTVGIALEGDLTSFVTIPKMQDYRPVVGETALVLTRGGKMYAIGAMPNSGTTAAMRNQRLWTSYTPMVTALSGGLDGTHTPLDAGDNGLVEGRYQLIDNTMDLKIVFYARDPGTALTPAGVMCFWLPPVIGEGGPGATYVSPYKIPMGLTESVGSARTYNGDLATTRYATGICIGVREHSFLWVYTQTPANGAMTTDSPIDWSAAADPNGVSVIMQIRLEVEIDEYATPSSG